MSDLFVAGPTSKTVRLYLGLCLLLGILTGCGGAPAPPPSGGHLPPPTFTPHYTGIFIFANRFAQVAVNGTLPFTADANYQASPTESTTLDVTGQATWSTSDATVATVNNSGVVTGVGTGSATITASFDGEVGTGVVVVNQKPTISITVDPPGDVISLRSNLQPEFYATATYPDGSQLDATYDVAWTADPSGVLKFGPDYTYAAGISHLVTVGKTTVTAKLKTGETGTYDVTVVP